MDWVGLFELKVLILPVHQHHIISQQTAGFFGPADANQTAAFQFYRGQGIGKLAQTLYQ